MDKKLPFLRCLPKRSLTFLYILCATVAAFVLASLYFERDEVQTNLLLPGNESASTVGLWVSSASADPSVGVSVLNTANFSGGSYGVHVVAVNDVRAQLNTDSNTLIVKAEPNTDYDIQPNTDSNVIVKAEPNADYVVTTSTPKTSKPPRKKTFINNTRYIYLTPSVNHTTSTTTTTQMTLTGGSSCSSDVEKDGKLILLWTSFFGYWNYFSQERLNRCKGCLNCRVTRDRSLSGIADAVVFHARDMSVSDLPPSRPPRQTWAFYCLESPVYSDFPGLRHMNGMFNLTVTYRRDSDVVARYGSVRKARPPRFMDFQRLRRAFKGKRRSVAFLSSHCPTDGGRDAFVTELSRHIDVDAYGDCGDRVCPMSAKDFCHEEFARNYKFLLAFENAVCKDYVTEKFYRTLAYDIVPVVFGGGPYEGLAPPGSFIDALKFKSPRHLAFFLRGVGEDFDRYVSYFKWRKDYSVDLANEKECDLCRILHDTTRKRSSYRDMKKWWVDGSQCRTWGP
ncbi:hypothetical protein JTE90_019383 [Oedothorax gibbosus]|uniref:Fucosyltransferase n=1 Tax=Oedothorax gibbosus TaxID=931172 RepID=A0AAV6UAG2_9ARAC|nr:hypothetical protein JTE90_019383 [Oedothorax gibbosus]